MIPLRNLRRFLHKTLKDPAYAFRVFRSRMRAYMNYVTGGGSSSYPEAITLFLTHRCNLHCKMCGQWGLKGVTRTQGAEYVAAELGLDVYKHVVDDVSAFKPSITLFGGEPLLYKGCIELIKYIKKNRMHCLIITNGFLVEETAKDIVDSGLDELNVSLDGGKELHDSIRGMPGLFDKVMIGLERLYYYKREMISRKPFLNLQCTITRYNYKQLEQMIDAARQAHADSLTFHNLIFINKDAMDRQAEYDKLFGSDSNGWGGFIFKPEIEPEILYKKIEGIMSGKYNFNVDFYPNFSQEELIRYYNDAVYFPEEYPARCVSPWMAAYIFPNGDVRPCLNSSYSYGNALNSKFAEIWNNEKAVKFRNFLREKRSFPVCGRCTEIYRY